MRGQLRRAIPDGSARERRDARVGQASLAVEERRVHAFYRRVGWIGCQRYTPGVEFEKTSTRLWKRLAHEDRAKAALAFWQEPSAETIGAAVAAIVKARHMRPQAVRKMSLEARAQALASVLDPGESVASMLLVALHLSERRGMLTAFLDAVGLPHEGGVLKDEGADAAVDEAAAQEGVRALAAFPPQQVETYLNTLWLQDPDRWQSLEAVSLG